jgi:hypothetical protein
MWKRFARRDATTATTGGRDSKLYPFSAALVWGTVMALFEESPHVLHPSLKMSMDEIYRQAPSWRQAASSSTHDYSGGI